MKKVESSSVPSSLPSIKHSSPPPDKTGFHFLRCGQSLLLAVVLVLGLDARPSAAQLSQADQALFQAIRQNNPTQVQQALDNGADVNAKNGVGHPALYEAAYSSTVAVVNTLLAHPNIKVNVHNGKRRATTPLHTAADRGRTDIVQALLAHPNINPNIQDSTLRTPLHYVVSGDHTGVAAALLAHPNIDVLVKNQDGYTPEQDPPANSAVVPLIQAHWRASRLFYAARLGQKNTVNRLVEQGGRNVNKPDGWDRTPLHLAAQHGRTATVKALLTLGASVIAQDKDGHTPLQTAQAQGHTAAARAISDHSAAMPEKWKKALKEMQMAAIKRLVSNGMDINRTVWIDPDYQTALHVAARAGHTELATFLLAHPDMKADTPGNPSRQTALHRAAIGGRTEIARLLLARSDVDVNRNDGAFTALYHAVAGGHTATVQALLAHPDIDVEVKDDIRYSQTGYTALHKAADGGHTAIVTALLEAGANIHARNTLGGGETPERVARRKGHTAIAQTLATYAQTLPEQLLEAARAVDTALVKRLLSNGVKDVNRANRFGTTPLHFAAESDDPALVSALLAHPGIQVDPQDTKGRTPLHLAADATEPAVLTALLNAGANVNAENANGRTPLHAAAQHGEPAMLTVLLNAPGIDVNRADTTSGETALHVAVWNGHYASVTPLLNAGANINAAKTNGRTALHLAVQRNSANIVTLLLANGANIDAADSRGQTALHRAAELGRTALATTLLNAGANVATADAKGRTALHLAAWKNHTALVTALLNAHAPIRATNTDGLTARQVAEQAQRAVRGYTATIAAFDTYGADMTTRWWAAIRAGDTTTVQRMLANGMDVNLRDSDGLNALFHLPSAANGGVKLADILLEAGAQAHGIWSQAGHPPLTHLAFVHHRYAVAAHLEDYERNVMAGGWLQAAASGNLALVQRLFSNGMPVGWTTADTWWKTVTDSPLQTALHTAAEAGQTAVVEFLLTHMTLADVQKQDRQGKTAQDLAAAGNHTVIVQAIDTFRWWAAAETGDTTLATTLHTAGFDVALQDDAGQTALHVAAAGGHAALVTALLAAGAEINLQDDAGQTALHVAAAGGHAATVTALLKAGANTTLTDTNDQTAQQVATAAGHTATATAIGTYLTSISADAWWAAVTRNDASAVTLMLSNGLEINRQHPQTGRTALHLAASHGHTSLVTLLLEAGAHATLTDTNDQTAQQVATAAGHTATATTLDTYTTAMPTQWWQAVKAGDAALVQRLVGNGMDVNTQDAAGRTALHHASLQDDTAVVTVLLAVAGIDAELPDNDGKSAVNYALQHLLDYYEAGGKNRNREWPTLNVYVAFYESLGTELLEVAAGGDVARVRYLIDNKVQISVRNKDGSTALQLAAANGHTEIVKLLLDASNGRMYYDGKNRTAYYIALENGHTETAAFIQDRVEAQLRKAAAENKYVTVKILIRDFGIDDVNAQDADGRTALHHAAVNGHWEILSLLSAQGTKFVDVSVTDKDGKTAFDLAKNQRTRDAITAYVQKHTEYFIKAARDGNLDLVKALLAAGVDVNVQHRGMYQSAKSNRTALNWASHEGHTAVVEFLLTQSGIDVNLQDDGSVFPLYGAVQHGNFEVVRLLLAHPDIDVNQQVKAHYSKLNFHDGNTALHIASYQAGNPIYDGVFRDKDKNKAFRPSSLALLKLLLARKDIDVTLRNHAGRDALQNVQHVSKGDDLTATAISLLTDHIRERLPEQLWQAFRAGDAARVGRLVQYDIGVNAADAVSGRPVLHEAIIAGDVNMVTALLAAPRVDVNWVNMDPNAGAALHDTALFLAVQLAVSADSTTRANGEAMVTALLTRTDLDVNTGGALLLAADKDQTAVIAQLLNHADIDVNHWDPNYPPDAYGVSQRTALHLAAAAGHTATVQTLLTAGADTDTGDYADQTALHLAAAAGHTATVQALIAAGADVHRSDANEQTAQQLAQAKGHTATVSAFEAYATDLTAQWWAAVKAGNATTVKRLLASGIDVNLRYNDAHNSYRQGPTALFRLPDNATGTAVADVLLAAGAQLLGIRVTYSNFYADQDIFEYYNSSNIFTPDFSAVVPNHLKAYRDSTMYGQWLSAARTGNLDLMQRLLSNGMAAFEVVTAEYANAAKQTALHVAAAAGQRTVVEFLLSHANLSDVDLTDAQGKTARDLAVAGRQNARVSAIVSAIDTFRWWAALEANPIDRKTAREIIATGFDVNRRNTAGQTALHLAAAAGDTQLVRALLAAEADLTLKNTAGQTAEQVASAAGQTNIATILSQPTTAAEQAAALWAAAWRGDKGTVKSLVQAGANVNVADADGWTALHFAADSGHLNVVKVLLGAAALDVNIQEQLAGETALHLAALSMEEAVVAALLAHADIDVTIQDDWQYTALHTAVDNEDVVIVTLLLNHATAWDDAVATADYLDMANDRGDTALHMAAERNLVRVLQLLLTAGADLILFNADKQRAEDVAEEFGHLEAQAVLQAALLESQEAAKASEDIDENEGPRKDRNQPATDDDDGQTPATDDNDQQPPVTEDDDQQPPVTEDNDQQPPVTEDDDQQPPVTEDDDPQLPVINDGNDLAPVINNDDGQPLGGLPVS